MSRSKPRQFATDKLMSRLRDLRDRAGHARPPERDERSDEDRFREEHHDGHARTICAAMVSAVALDEDHHDHAAAASIRVRLIRNPPAPVMDGFVLAGMRGGHVYDVDIRTGQYLIVAGYGLRVDDDPSDRRRR